MSIPDKIVCKCVEKQIRKPNIALPPCKLNTPYITRLTTSFVRNGDIKWQYASPVVYVDVNRSAGGWLHDVKQYISLSQFPVHWQNYIHVVKRIWPEQIEYLNWSCSMLICEKTRLHYFGPIDTWNKQ